MNDTVLRIAAVVVPMLLLFSLGIDIGKRRARRAADELRAGHSVAVSGVNGSIPADPQIPTQSFNPPAHFAGPDGRLWEIKTDGNWYPPEEAS